DDLLGQLVDRPLDAASRDAADDLVTEHGHRRAGWTRGATEGVHHGGHAECLTGFPPTHDLGEYVTHEQASPPGPRTRPGCARPRSRRRMAVPRASPRRGLLM